MPYVIASTTSGSGFRNHGMFTPVFGALKDLSNSDNAYDELIRSTQMYSVGMVIHSADLFLVDQRAVIIQMALRIGTQNIFVSMLDYDLSDSTETLLNLCEAVLTLLCVPFSIRKVPPVTEDPAAAYYPLEAHTRNLVLEPLYKFYRRREVKFHRVIWLKGFTCRNDIFEAIMQFNLSSAASAGPPRDPAGAARYAQHLPFQVFCCESSTHVVDHAQTFYTGLTTRACRSRTSARRTTCRASTARRPPRTRACVPSRGTRARWARAWIQPGWGAAKPMEAAVAAGENARRRHAKRAEEAAEEGEEASRAEEDEQVNRAEEGEHGSRVDEGHVQCQRPPGDLDANLGSDFDAMPDTGEGEADSAAAGEDDALADTFSIPNGVFRAARILVNPQ
ncbi:hypothetical protein DFH11DRAFT_1843917 [Phellopilus nigrolimitatus]|nr:hypothetical protein DFH11DRAFT_1843917 [Phellopilus nigrolimitatus]